jgi:hypothetical protein
MGENLYQLYIRLIIRIYRDLIKLNSPKFNKLINKLSNELNRVFSKEQVQIAKKEHEKVFIMPGQKGHANQSNVKITHHSSLE